MAAAATRDLSLLGLFLQADIVVKSVMIGLLVASVICWAVIFEKMFRVWRLNREINHLQEAADAGALPAAGRRGLNTSITEAANTEWSEGVRSSNAGEVRDRLEVAMRGAMRRELKGIEKGLPFLATLGSAAPFIGLFGTVWGIMNSFAAIAQQQDTSLAVVAPGIAEALFATAIGLAAAIPAVIAYNQISVALGRASEKIGPAITDLARSLARRSAQGTL